MDSFGDYFSEDNRARINSIKSLNHFCLSVFENSSKSIFSLKKELSSLSNNEFLEDLINYELSQIKANAYYVPTFSTIKHLNLFDCKYCSLFLHAFNPNEAFNNSKHCSSHSGDRLIMGLAKQGVEYDLYEQLKPYPIDVLDESRPLLIKEKKAILSYGEILCLRKDYDVLSYSSVGTDKVFILVLYEKPEGQYIWEYDQSTLLPVRIVAGNYQSTSRIEQICSILGEMGNEKGLPVLFSLIAHDDYNIRWESARAIMFIDFLKGVKALNLLKDDDNPIIRETVRNSLRQVDQYIDQSAE